MTLSSSQAKRGLIIGRRLFSTAHHYTQKAMAPEQNRAEFGRCHTKWGHGHNYVLELALEYVVGLAPEGSMSQGRGAPCSRDEIDTLLLEVCDPVDHVHLNFDVEAFRGDSLVPTTENLALYLREKTLEALARRSRDFPQLKRLRLFETDDLWSEIVEDTTP